MKKNQMGFTHNLALMVIGVLVLGVVGFAGFNVYKNKNNSSAAAYSWTTISFSSNNSWAEYRVCKSKVSANRWLVRYQFVSGDSTIKVPVRDAGGTTVIRLVNNPTYVGFLPYTFDKVIVNC